MSEKLPPSARVMPSLTAAPENPTRGAARMVTSTLGISAAGNAAKIGLPVTRWVMLKLPLSTPSPSSPAVTVKVCATFQSAPVNTSADGDTLASAASDTTGATRTSLPGCAFSTMSYTPRAVSIRSSGPPVRVSPPLSSSVMVTVATAGSNTTPLPSAALKVTVNDSSPSAIKSLEICMVWQSDSSSAMKVNGSPAPGSA